MKIVDPRTGHTYYSKLRRRFDEPRQPRELTFSCYAGYRFLGRDRTREWFREALEEARAKFGFHIWAYVVMPEHVHLLVYPGDNAKKMAEFLQKLKEPIGRKAIAHLKTHHPKWLKRIRVEEGNRTRHRFWQPGGGYDRNVTSTEALRAMIEYIHANPVRRGLVSKPEDWEWSSARWFAGIRPAWIEIDTSVIDELVFD